jgi:hypothetical protein
MQKEHASCSAAGAPERSATNSGRSGIFLEKQCVAFMALLMLKAYLEAYPFS